MVVLLIVGLAVLVKDIVKVAGRLLCAVVGLGPILLAGPVFIGTLAAVFADRGFAETGKYIYGLATLRSSWRCLR